jgi:RNA polymerase sigma-70 factor (ECF subfamily)
VDSLKPSELLERCRAGDELAWEAFVLEFQSRLYALAYSYVGDREEARDLAQEIFIRLYETRHRWARGDEFLPWLFKVARNRSVDYLRRRRVRTPPAAVHDPETLAALPDAATSSEALAVEADRRSLLRAALQGLSAISREIVVLRDVHGLSVQHVAAILGVPVGTVKSRASRARVELMRRMLPLRRAPGAEDVP